MAHAVHTWPAMHSPWRQPERLLHWRRGQLPEAPEAALLLRHALSVADKAGRWLPLRHCAPRSRRSMPRHVATKRGFPRQRLGPGRLETCRHARGCSRHAVPAAAGRERDAALVLCSPWEAPPAAVNPHRPVRPGRGKRRGRAGVGGALPWNWVNWVLLPVAPGQLRWAPSVGSTSPYLDLVTPCDACGYHSAHRLFGWKWSAARTACR
jgi:hypothetical protein